MEVKKSPKADLEGKKSTWLLVGYVVVLAFMFVAFFFFVLFVLDRQLQEALDHAKA